MLQASRRPYVCWRCVARRLGPGPSPRWSRTLSATGPFRSVAQNSNLASTRGLATVLHAQSNHDVLNGPSSAEQQPARKIPIREHLRAWEQENPGEAEAMLEDFPDSGNLSNNLTRPQNVGMVQFDVGPGSPLFVDDELVDLRSDDATLGPGDLVELSSRGSRRPGLAICLGRINGYEHFYTVSGKWFPAIGVTTLFVVHKYVTPKELEPVIAALPPAGVSIEDLNVLQDLRYGPSRAAGAPLLRKMLTFAQEAEAVYQANAGTLDASSSFIGDPVKHRYLTLHEIAELLLTNADKRGGKFTPQSLYAVHRALLQDEVFFRPLRQRGHKRSYLFEISPLSEVRIVQKVEKMVREYLTRPRDDKIAWVETGTPVGDFLMKARKIIDLSRKHREYSHYGIIGPSTKEVPGKPDWSATDLEILEFMELWASYQKFPESSSLQTHGSAILRAIGRYEEARGYLPATGWTFLQEVGWIPPWEIPTRYTVRFPGVAIQRGGSYVRPFLGVLDRHLKQDILAPVRKPLEGVTAYCIDSITAHEIDDAVSLEKTSNPEEYWINVHVADPASSFGADTPLAKHAELIPESIYLPGHLESMLPQSVVQGRFSLAPDRPCLTFSALVNRDGVVLDEKITANTLKDVVYITYEDVASAIGDTREFGWVEDAEWSLGTMPKIKTADRKLTRADDLSTDQKSDLTILSKLGKAIQAKRLAKGATPFFQPRPTADVRFDGVKVKESDSFITTSGDPKIRVYYSQQSETDLVENAMKLANEVVARWCYERGIPIPYRTQPHALHNAALVQQYARDVLNPMLISGVRPEESVWRHMRALIGIDEVSTRPGPHFTLGSDMYTKATSPLRRFGDLIVHWQVGAALLEERRLGRKLVGREDNEGPVDDLSFLPFGRERLNRMLPIVRLCEKQARAITNADGSDQWILQAMVRAWHFKEGSLPETFKMTVWHLNRSGLLGRLDWFDRAAILKKGALNGVVLSRDVRLGDVLEVRLQDIDIHSNQIFVEAVRVLEKATDEGKSG